VEKKRKEWEAFVALVPKYPEGLFNGRGIVIPAGGKYMALALVTIRVLREKGCTLPIELWYKGAHERPTFRLHEELDLLRVTCYDLDEFFTGDGYATKPLAILASRFQEVFLLDPDSLPIRDIAHLFAEKEYLTHGAVFWPDYWDGENMDYSIGKNHTMWKIINKPPTDLRTQESGQVLIDKQRHWLPLLLTVFFNFRSKYYYTILDGDKDTFRFSWVALGANYHMINHTIGSAGYVAKECNDRKYVSEKCAGFHGHTMVQYGFDGKVLFLHRNLAKWPANAGVNEFMYDEERDRTWTTIQEWRGGKRDANGNIQLIMEWFGIRMMGDVVELSFLDEVGYDLEKKCYEILKELKYATYFQEYVQRSEFVCLIC